MKYRFIFIAFLLFSYINSSFSRENMLISQDTTSQASHEDGQHAHADHGSGHDEHHAEFDPGATAIHHISDANVYSILDAVRIPLPMILYSKEKGLEMFSSGKFHAGHHEDGHSSYNGYVLRHGSVHRVADAGFPMEGSVEIEGFSHKEEEDAKGKKRDIYFAKYQGKEFRLDARSTMDGGILGGGFTSFIDFSITKNVVSMILVSLLLFWLFRRAAVAYGKNPDKAPSGAQGMIEPILLFIRDDVAIPFIGKKYAIFLPFLLSVFFFILGLNLWGQVPFLGSVNVTGSLSVTMVLAILVFILVNVNGNGHYWGHIFWMPGVPVPIKILLACVEVMGLFIKPLTLMLRLAGNISAGHIAILSFIGLIFIFGKSGESLGGSLVGTAVSIPLTMFMMAIEIIVAFVQAFVFTILTASFIGAATEEHHHDHEHAEGIHH